MSPSLDREKDLLRGRPKRVDCCGSRCAWNDLKTVSTPACLRRVGSRGVASYRTLYQQTLCPRRHPIDLKMRNATPLRSAWCVRGACYYALRFTRMGTAASPRGAAWGGGGLADDEFGRKHFSLCAAAAAKPLQHQLDCVLAHFFDGLGNRGDRRIDIPHPKGVVEGHN